MTRVLIVRLDSMGDVLLAGPAVRAVAAAPDVDEVLLLCGPLGAGAARLLLGVDRLLVWECPWIARDAPSATPSHLERLLDLLDGAGRIDRAVILTSFHQSSLPTALALRLAGIPFIGGISTDYPGTLLDVRVRPVIDVAEDLPEPERALAVVRACGYELPEVDDGRLAVVDGEPVPAEFRMPERYVVVHPGASAPARRWSPARFAQAVAALRADGWEVIVTGGDDERDLAALVSDDGRLARSAAGALSLPQLVSLLRDAAVVVCGNTGPAHLAAAVGTPVVSLFSPVVPATRWAPYRVPFVLLGDQQAPCRDTRAVTCPVPGHPCLETVTAEDVVAACDALAADLPVEAMT